MSSGTENNLTEEITDLVYSHEKQLLRYAGRLLRSPESAQDAVQEAFIRYLRYRGSNDEPIENPKAWLYRVTHNLALDVIRKEQRRAGAQDELTHKENMRQVKGPDTVIATRDSERVAWELLEELPEREQQIVSLKVIDSRSYKEIAEIMELTTTNVGFILHTTMKKLGRRMRELSNTDQPNV